MEWLSTMVDRLDSRERYEKRLNVIIKGVKVGAGCPLEMAVEFIAKHFSMIKNVREEIVKVSLTGKEGNLLVSLKSYGVKMEILKAKKRCLMGLPFYVEADRTALEREIDARAREFARGHRGPGSSAKVSHNGVFVENDWFAWNHAAGTFVKQQFVSKKNKAVRSSSKNVSNEGDSGSTGA